MPWPHIKSHISHLFLSYRIDTKSFFKSTDRNSYIPIDSCHHPSWLKNVPKSQFLCIRHNCNNYDDFIQQSSVLKTRFLEKGYAIDSLIAYNNINKKERKIFCPLITNFSVQHYQIKKIIQNPWNILQVYPVLKTILPDKP